MTQLRSAKQLKTKRSSSYRRTWVKMSGRLYRSQWRQSIWGPNLSSSIIEMITTPDRRPTHHVWWILRLQSVPCDMSTKTGSHTLRWSTGSITVTRHAQKINNFGIRGRSIGCAVFHRASCSPVVKTIVLVSPEPTFSQYGYISDINFRFKSAPSTLRIS